MTTQVTKTHLMQLVAKGTSREAFEHDELGMFDVTAMRKVARERGELVTVAMSAVAPFVMDNRVFELARVNALSPNEIDDPILYVRIVEPFPQPISFLLIDGAHRVMRRWRDNLDTVQAYILDEKDIVRPDFTQLAKITDLGVDWGEDLGDFRARRGI